MADLPTPTDDMESLKQRLAALEAENRQLKGQQVGNATGGTAAVAHSAVPSDGDAATPVTGKRAKTAKWVELRKAKIAATRLARQAAKAVKGQADKAGPGAAAASSLADGPSAPVDEDSGHGLGRPAGSCKKRASGSSSSAPGAAEPCQTAAATAAAAAWSEVDMSAWKEFGLHPLLEQGLAMQGFTRPTAIQAAVLPAACRDGSDVIGAAQTGSGKTLAFGLPIFQRLLQEREMQEAEAAEAGPTTSPLDGRLRALIMTPTRELALQVSAHLTALGKVARIRVAAIVGGLAHVKQTRLLAARPSVLVATPGRLWELLREASSPHLADFGALSFLVLDEADRMAQKGHFQELESILDLIPRPGVRLGATYEPDFQETLAASTALEAAGRTESGARALAEQGASEGLIEDLGGEGDEQMEEEEEGEGEETEGGNEEQGEAGQQQAASREVGNAGQVERSKQAGGREQGIGKAAGKKAGGRKAAGQWGSGGPLQTLVFSATLTLPKDMRRRLKKGKGGGALGSTDLDSLMDMVPFRGDPAIVDLTAGSHQVAAGVTEAYVPCMEGSDRDALLYYLLVKHPGRTLVFANAVTALRRVAALLKVLGLPAHAIHAQQQQRQRLKALDRFKSDDQAVLVASDVAARGLDIPGVRCVIHYQLPASADTYIHRSGRTGRGVGSSGLALALVAPDEAVKFRTLCRALGKDSLPPSFPIDKTLMPLVVQRVKLALKIDEVERAMRKELANSSWATRQAAEAGLDEPGDSDQPAVACNGVGRKRGRGDSHKPDDEEDSDDDQTLRNKRARIAQASSLLALKAQLAHLLAVPLAPKMSRAFFTGGAAAGVAVSGAAARGGSLPPQAVQHSPADATGTAAAHVATARDKPQQGRHQPANEDAVFDAGASAAATLAHSTAAASSVQAAIAVAKHLASSAAAASEAVAARSRSASSRHSKRSKQRLVAAAPSTPQVSIAVTGAMQPKKYPSKEALAFQELAKRAARKQRRKGGGAAVPAANVGKVGKSAHHGASKRMGLVVIPPALGRDTTGAEALEALKRRMAV
ncbi:P-loop containing nucleoside triphosphate hydrolase protein [Haematococcus lacustris]